MLVVQVYSSTGKYAHLSHILYCEEHHRISTEVNTCACFKKMKGSKNV